MAFSTKEIKEEMKKEIGQYRSVFLPVYTRICSTNLENISLDTGFCDGVLPNLVSGTYREDPGEKSHSHGEFPIEVEEVNVPLSVTEFLESSQKKRLY